METEHKWCVAVTTAPRPEPTLEDCLYSLRCAGWDPMVFAEPRTEVPQNVKAVRNPKQLGVWHNWKSSAQWSVDNTDADLIMTVQDDAKFHPDSKVFTESILWPCPRTGFISLYTPKHYSDSYEPGVNEVITHNLWGACALVWPRAVLEQVLATTIARKWRGARPRKNPRPVMRKRRDYPNLVANSDTAIGKIMNNLKRTMWFVDPSPVRHIAEKSTIGHGNNKGRRNCSRCACWKKTLQEQVPAPEEKWELQ